MLTKKECLLKYNALKNLSDYPILCGTENDENLKPTPFNELFKEELECFEKLINEHFELWKAYENLHVKVIKYRKLFANPPLKFEDLKHGMWVWDNKIKEYIKLYRNNVGLGYQGYDIKIDTIDWFDLEFEENRFYIYEVKENE